MKKTPEEIIENNPILKTIIIDGNDEYRGGAIQQAIEKVMQEYATQCQQDNAESDIYLIYDCDRSSVLSAHLTEESAEKEVKELRKGFAPSVTFDVQKIQIKSI